MNLTTARKRTKRRDQLKANGEGYVSWPMPEEEHPRDHFVRKIHGRLPSPTAARKWAVDNTANAAARYSDAPSSLSWMHLFLLRHPDLQISEADRADVAKLLQNDNPAARIEGEVSLFAAEWFIRFGRVIPANLANSVRNELEHIAKRRACVDPLAHLRRGE